MSVAPDACVALTGRTTCREHGSDTLGMRKISGSQHTPVSTSHFLHGACPADHVRACLALCCRHSTQLQRSRSQEMAESASVHVQGRQGVKWGVAGRLATIGAARAVLAQNSTHSQSGRTNKPRDRQGRREVCGQVTFVLCPSQPQAAPRLNVVESMRIAEKLTSLSKPGDMYLETTRTRLSAQPTRALRTEVRFVVDTQPNACAQKHTRELIGLASSPMTSHTHETGQRARRGREWQNADSPDENPNPPRFSPPSRGPRATKTKNVTTLDCGGF